MITNRESLINSMFLIYYQGEFLPEKEFFFKGQNQSLNVLQIVDGIPEIFHFALQAL